MIYIEFDSNNKESFLHLNVFDPKYGLNKTETELLKTGILVESLPQHTQDTFGKDFALFNNPLRYEYFDRPLNLYEKIVKLYREGKITQEEMNDLLQG